MRFFSILSIALLAVSGCASKQEVKQEVYLTQSPIKIEIHELGDYWIQLSEGIRFGFKPNTKLPKKDGYVRINYLIDSNGEIFNPSILESSPEGAWDLFALKALSKLEYVPAESNTLKIPVYVTSEFKFQSRQM